MQNDNEMPFRKYMDPKTNPLFPDSKLPLEIREEDKTIIEGMYGNLLDKRYNPLMPGSPLDAKPCRDDCERRAFMADLIQLGADPDEVRDIMAGYQNDPGCHECST